MAVNGTGLRIEGLRELQAALKAIDGESQKELRLVLNEAAEIVAKGARQRASKDKKTGRALGSIKVASSQREARVQEGGGKAPYAQWLDFGGSTGRGHQPRKAGSGSIKRPFLKDGRYVYPAFYAQETNIGRLLDKRLTNLIQRHGLEVSDNG